jgi:hypothetical protein
MSEYIELLVNLDDVEYTIVDTVSDIVASDIVVSDSVASDIVVSDSVAYNSDIVTSNSDIVAYNSMFIVNLKDMKYNDRYNKYDHINQYPELCDKKIDDNEIAVKAEFNDNGTDVGVKAEAEVAVKDDIGVKSEVDVKDDIGVKVEVDVKDDIGVKVDIKVDIKDDIDVKSKKVPSKTTSISPIDKVCGKKKRQLENKKNVK